MYKYFLVKYLYIYSQPLKIEKKNMKRKNNGENVSLQSMNNNEIWILLKKKKSCSLIYVTIFYVDKWLDLYRRIDVLWTNQVTYSFHSYLMSFINVSNVRRQVYKMV